MSVLVIAEHEAGAVKPASLHAVTAAKELGSELGEVTVLIAGADCRAAAEAAAGIEGVSKVLVADDAAYADGLAENVAPLVVALAGDHSHVLATATTVGKNLMPRIAASICGRW